MLIIYALAMHLETFASFCQQRQGAETSGCIYLEKAIAILVLPVYALVPTWLKKTVYTISKICKHTIVKRCMSTESTSGLFHFVQRLPNGFLPFSDL